MAKLNLTACQCLLAKRQRRDNDGMEIASTSCPLLVESLAIRRGLEAVTIKHALLFIRLGGRPRPPSLPR